MSENEMKVSENNVGNEIFGGCFSEAMEALDKALEIADRIIEREKMIKKMEEAK